MIALVMFFLLCVLAFLLFVPAGWRVKVWTLVFVVLLIAFVFP